MLSRSNELTRRAAAIIIDLRTGIADERNPMIKRLKKLYATNRNASLLILFVVLNIYMLIEIKNDRFWLSDFSVYHEAAGRILQGENLYRGESDGFYHYKYSPTAALYFAPLGVLPLHLAKVIYWVLLSGAICLGFYLSTRLAIPDIESVKPACQNNIILVSALVMGVNIERELHLGQVNQILLVCYLSFFILLKSKKEILASLVWSASVFLKPFGLILLPYLLVRKKFKTFFFSLVFLVLLGILPVLFVGFGSLKGQFSGWVTELTIELSGKQELLNPGNHTVFSVLARYTPIRLLISGSGAVLVLQSLMLILIALIFVLILLKGRGTPNRMALESAFLMGLIPLLAFTSYNAFGFLELAVVLVLLNLPRMRRLLAGISLAGLILVGFNMHDIVGHRLWVLFNDLSLVSAGAIVLLAVLFRMRIRGLA